MDLMSDYEDNHFDLAIVDPPYGLGVVSFLQGESKKPNSFLSACNGVVGSEWDSAIPNADYFKELQRVSKQQIIWGGNHFLDHLGNTSCFLIWDKINGTNYMADCELAWTNLKGSNKIFAMHHFSEGYQKKIHPTQKPVRLYDWILSEFAKPGMQILDTHLGSGSIAIAAHNAGMLLTASEIDKHHYDGAIARIRQATTNQPRPNHVSPRRNNRMTLKINRRAGQLVFVKDGRTICQHEGIRLAQKSLGLTRKEFTTALGYKSRGLDTYYLKTGTILPAPVMLRIMQMLK